MSKLFTRFIALIMMIVLVASFGAGCGNSDAENSDSSGSKANNGISAGIDPEDYRDTEVTYVTWKDPNLNEDGLAVEKFEKEYGIKVNVQLVAQSKYVNTIAADIAAGTQGDIFFENGTFPASLNVMQPLDAACLDLSDPIWNQALVKASTLAGHPYLVDTVSNVWSEVDICVYNKHIFESNNITSPEEYYEAGKWTFANFRKAAADVSALGKDYTGACLIGNPALAAAGSAFFTYKDDRIHSKVDDHLYQVMNFLSQMHSDGLVTLSRSDFQDGRHGMAITNCFGLKKTGYFTQLNPDQLGATYMPKWDENSEHQVSGIYRGWGLIDGTDNPVAAGLFLREYLDVNNYDLEETFQNKEVGNFFFQVTGEYSESTLHYLNLKSAVGMGELYNESWSTNTPDQMKTYIDSNLHVINQMCDKANDIIAKELKQIEEDEASGKLSKPE